MPPVAFATVIVRDVVPDVPLRKTARETLYVPAARILRRILRVEEEPSPNDHCQAVGAPVD